MSDEEYDDLWGLFDRESALRVFRRTAIGFGLLMLLSAVVWAVVRHWPDTAVEKAQSDLAFIEGRGTPDEICKALQKLAQVYREEQNAKEYEMAKLHADGYCRNIELERRLGM